MSSEKRIIEINGVKLEVDLSTAKVIEEYKVGSNIKVLVKEYNTYSSYIGTIIGFDNFEKHPTIVIAYLKTDYNSAEIKYVYFNNTTENIEITHLNDWDIPVTRDEIIRAFDLEINKHKSAIKDAENRKHLFHTLFGKYFNKLERVEVPNEF